MVKYVLAASEWGLCNRLKAMISAMRLADSLGAEALIYWPVTEKVPARLSDLFSGGPREISALELEQIRKANDEVIEVDHWRLAVLDSDNVPPDLTWQSTVPGKRVIDYCYEKIPKSVIDAYLPYFKKLVPVEEVIQRTTTFASALPSSTVAIHLRSWKVMGDGKTCFYSEKNFLQAVQPYRGHTFFIATDSESALNHFAKRVKNPVQTIPVESRGHDSKAKIIDAITELYLLARPKVLIGSFVSTFSEFAWWLGGCSQKVIIPDPKRYLWKRIGKDIYCRGYRWTFRAD